jgi:hypothetical protein
MDQDGGGAIPELCAIRMTPTPHAMAPMNGSASRPLPVTFLIRENYLPVIVLPRFSSAAVAIVQKLL